MTKREPIDMVTIDEFVALDVLIAAQMYLADARSRNQTALDACARLDETQGLLDDGLTRAEAFGHARESKRLDRLEQTIEAFAQAYYGRNRDGE